MLSITGPREPPKRSMNCKNGHDLRMTGGTKWNPNMEMRFILSEVSSALSSPHPTQFSSPSYGRNFKTAATVAENLQIRFGTVTTRVPPGLSARHISRTACIGFNVCPVIKLVDFNEILNKRSKFRFPSWIPEWSEVN